MAEGSKTMGGTMPVTDVPHAPFVYFEEVVSFSTVNGLVRITLAAERTLAVDGKVAVDQLVTAYLRTNIQGARSLIDALEKTILLAIPSEPTEKPN